MSASLCVDDPSAIGGLGPVFGLSGGLLPAAAAACDAAPIIAASSAASRITIGDEGLGGPGDVIAGAGQLRGANRGVLGTPLH
jgi:hypothetical protein